MKNLSSILRATPQLDIRLIVSPEPQSVREAAWQHLCQDAHYHDGYILLFIPIIVAWEQGAHPVKNVWKSAKKLSVQFSELLGCDVHVARFAISEATMAELKCRDMNWPELLAAVLKEAHNRSWSHLHIEQTYDLTAEQIRLASMVPDTIH